MYLQRYISPSKLDMFQGYLNGYAYKGFNVPDYTKEAFIRDLIGAKVSDWTKADIGSAFHSVIEHAGFKTIPSEFTEDGFNFKIDCDIKLVLPANREQAVTRTIDGVTINGKVDAVSDTKIHDIKTTGWHGTKNSTYDIEHSTNMEKFIESWQWKCYLWMTGLDEFEYNVFELEHHLREDNTIILSEVKNYLEIPCGRYDGLDSDVEGFIRHYMEFLRDNEQLIKDMRNDTASTFYTYSSHNAKDMDTPTLTKGIEWAYHKHIIKEQKQWFYKNDLDRLYPLNDLSELHIDRMTLMPHKSNGKPIYVLNSALRDKRP